MKFQYHTGHMTKRKPVTLLYSLIFIIVYFLKPILVMRMFKS